MIARVENLYVIRTTDKHKFFVKYDEVNDRVMLVGNPWYASVFSARVAELMYVKLPAGEYETKLLHDVYNETDEIGVQ